VDCDERILAWLTSTVSRSDVLSLRTVASSAAIACAVYDALGVPVRSLPITPDRVLAALGRA